MSVDGYLGPNRGELRLKQGDVLGKGAVIGGRASVEAAREEAARRAVRAGPGTGAWRITMRC
jgi:hypothetical protein